MSNDDIEVTEDDNLFSKRRTRVRREGGASKALVGIFAVAFVALGLTAIVMANGGLEKVFGFGASDSEVLQEASRPELGISTQLPAPTREPEFVQLTPRINVPADPPEPRELNEAEKRRIAELEEQLRQLQNQPKEQSITPEQLTKLLASQAATLRDEAKRDREQQAALFRQQMTALQNAIPKGPTAEEIAEREHQQRLAEQEERERQLRLQREEEERQRRLREEADARRQAEQLAAEARARAEERRAEAEELRRRQIESEGLVFDGSEEGQSAPGSEDRQRNGNVRELSANEAFLADAASSGFETSRANTIDTTRTVAQGTIISAVLETAINTELPGNIRASTTEPVFSFDGERVLMPAGTRLIGTFNSDISTAQNRVLIAWNRAITPNGESVELGSTGTDRLGRSGTRGNVNRRFLARFGTAILITTISALPSFLASESEDTNVEAATDVANAASDDLSNQTENALQDQLTLPPIIRVPQGEDIRIFVNRDLVFS